MPVKNKNISVVNVLQVRQVSAQQVVFGEALYKPGGVLGPRVQRDYQLVVLYEGEMNVTVSGTSRYIPPQHMTVLLPGNTEDFRFTRETSTRHGWCAVHPSLVSKALKTSLRRAPVCLPLSARMRTLLDLGLGVRTAGSPSAEALLMSLGDGVLWEFLHAAEGAGEGGALHPVVQAARELIESNFADPLTLASISRAAGVTPQHLIRLFRQTLSTTPIRTLWEARLRRGVQLLGGTGLTVSEIAYQAGFKSPFHFSRLLKERQGAGPRELRRRMWGRHPR